MKIFPIEQFLGKNMFKCWANKRSKFAQIKLIFCQSGNILPNLVTLAKLSLLVTAHITYHYKLENFLVKDEADLPGNNFN